MGMSPTPPARRLRLGMPRRVFSQVLLMQVAIAAGVAVLATGLFLAPLSEQLDDQAMRRALAIAQTTAAQPQIAEDLVSTRPSVDGPVQVEAERIRKASGAEYVVVMDTGGVRWSHPDPAEIGGLVSTDPAPRPGRATRSWRSTRARWAAPPGARCRCVTPTGKIVGAVSVGIEYDSVRARLIHAIPGLLAYAGGAMAVGALAAYLISRRVQRQTRDLAFSDIAGLLAEREAMLHGIREGVVALDRAGPRTPPERRGAAAARDRRRGGRQVARRRARPPAVRPMCWPAGSPAPTCSPCAASACWSPTACPPTTAAPSPPCATAPSWSSSAANSTPRAV